jgi:hypothetical protein
MRIQADFIKSRVIVVLTGTFLCGIVILVFINKSSNLAAGEARDRIKLLLSKEITQGIAHDLRNKTESTITYEAGLHMKKSLTDIKAIEFDTITIRKLIPDFLLKPHRPTHIVRVEMRIHDIQYPPRYFWLSWSSIDRETTKYAWYFAL